MAARLATSPPGKRSCTVRRSGSSKLIAKLTASFWLSNVFRSRLGGIFLRPVERRAVRSQVTTHLAAIIVALRVRDRVHQNGSTALDLSTPQEADPRP